MKSSGGLALLATSAHVAHSLGMLPGPIPAQVLHAGRDAQTRASLKSETGMPGNGLSVEKWLPVVGAEGRYEVSDAGRVRSLDSRVRLVAHGTETTRLARGQLLRPGRTGPFGHVSVAIGRGNSRLVHHLVAEAFIGPRPPGLDVAHADGDGGNNRLSNLRYATRSENNRDLARRGDARLTPADVARIRREAPALPFGGKKRLALALGVSPCVVSSVLAGRSYAHV